VTGQLVGEVGDAAVDCIAGGEGGGDDKRAEHEADDDEDGLGHPAGDVAHAHLEHDAVAQQHIAHGGQGDQQRSHQAEHDVVHRQAE